MGTSSSNGSYLSIASARGLVRKAADAVNASHGYMLPDGRRDNPKIRGRLLEVAERPGIITAKNMRAKLAVLREVLVTELYPNLPGPEDFDDQPNPELADDVYKQVDSNVWDETKMDYDSPLQRLVAEKLGNGFVLCRYKIGRAWAVYLTNDVVCIDIDFLRKDNEKGERVLTTLEANRGMLIDRLPQHAKRFVKDYDERLGGAMGASIKRLRLLAENASTADTSAGTPGPSGPPAQGSPVQPPADVDADVDGEDADDEE